jgi:RNA polymerase sigma-70 factor (ECF subfamily)
LSSEDHASGDQELLRSIREKDQDAFRTLVERYREKVFRICLSFVKDPEEAEELTQDVFFRVYKSAGGFRGESLVSTWIHRIAVNQSLNRLRKRGSRKWLLFLGGGELLDQRFGTGESPEALVERRERREALQKALDRLPAGQRIAFTLHNVEAVSYEEIARIMDCSVSAVESKIHRAKLNLQKHLIRLYKKRS